MFRFTFRFISIVISSVTVRHYTRRHSNKQIVMADRHLVAEYSKCCGFLLLRRPDPKSASSGTRGKVKHYKKCYNHTVNLTKVYRCTERGDFDCSYVCRLYSSLEEWRMWNTQEVCWRDGVQLWSSHILRPVAGLVILMSPHPLLIHAHTVTLYGQKY